MANTKYREYFDINEQYFPQINDSSIKNNPNLWINTFPHESFIKMLREMERALSRKTFRSIWIEGVYGTGKSQCAYALKKILDAPKEEIQEYWDKYTPLKKERDLLGKIIGHRDRKIVTAYRYASGGISSPRELFFAIQDTLKTSLENSGLYTGEKTLKESVIAWIDDPLNKKWFDSLLKEPKFSSMFSQSNADEVLYSLHKGGEVKELMDNIFKLADDRGITALNIDTDRFIAWLTDIIDENKIKIVFIWDEFSDYFNRNKESLSEFQKLVEFVNNKPFFFVPVTHLSEHLFVEVDKNWKRIRDRFEFTEISLPDNIAFHLIGHAFSTKGAAKANWNEVAKDLNEKLIQSRKIVAEATKTDAETIREFVPIHPLTALLLKSIAAAFGSNQRSMFNFIKSSNTDEKAFQWFIEQKGPGDDHPFLTVDMLWDFFYEKGRNHLEPSVRMILDTFGIQDNLTQKEQRVLKVILIMQAMDQGTGGKTDIFKATRQNLSYVFEGIPDLDGPTAGNIAESLKNKGILITIPLANNQSAYVVAVLAGDQAEIERDKEVIRKNTTTSELVKKGEFSNLLKLDKYALRLRFEPEVEKGITLITIGDKKQKINNLSNIDTTWNFHAVIAVAKNETEAVTFRKDIQEWVANKQYEHIVFIDATYTPLGESAFEQYIDISAMEEYYRGNNKNESDNKRREANKILADWAERIYEGQFVIYTYDNPTGEKFNNGKGVESALKTIVIKKFNMLQHFDFVEGITANQIKLSQGKNSASYGVYGIAKSSPVKTIEKNLFPSLMPNPWKVDKYWENPHTMHSPVSKLKIEVNTEVESAFSEEGKIGIGSIYNLLVKKGFAPSNLTAFVFGFLMKEYSEESYRYIDAQSGHSPMSKEKLAEMINNVMGKNPKPAYIVKTGTDEMAFYELSKKAWGISPGHCSSPGEAAKAIQGKMRGLGLPIWCLKEIDKFDVFDIIHKYMELVQKEGRKQFEKATELGKIFTMNPSLGDSLSELLTPSNCQNAMIEFLNSFEEGKILKLAKEINMDEKGIIKDIRRLFEGVMHSYFWDKQTGEEEIGKLIPRYGFVRESNLILNVATRSVDEAFKAWRENLKFIGISHEALIGKYPNQRNLFEYLLKIYQQKDILPNQLKSFLSELEKHRAEIKMILEDRTKVFTEVYEPYLEQLTGDDIAKVKSSLKTGLFELPSTDCNKKVKETAENFRKNQVKTQLFRLWKDKTGTKNPIEWSQRYRTPILSCIPMNEFESAKKAFSVLNRNHGTDTEIKEALSYLESTEIFDIISDEDNRNTAFRQNIIGEYAVLLQNLNQVREALEFLTVDTYDWPGNPSIKAKIEQKALAEYTSGGSDKAISKIDNMSDSLLKQYLKRLIKDNMTIGIEIIADGGEDNGN